MKRLLILFLVQCLALSCYAQTADTPATLAGRLLDTVSGDQGEERDWQAFHSYFVKDARLSLLRNTDDSTMVIHMTVAAFVEVADANSKKRGFYEYEITEPLVRIYGDMATVWQPYAIRFNLKGEETGRGINVYHMLKVNGSWKIAFLTWQMQEEALPVADWQEQQ